MYRSAERERSMEHSIAAFVPWESHGVLHGTRHYITHCMGYRFYSTFLTTSPVSLLLHGLHRGAYHGGKPRHTS